MAVEAPAAKPIENAIGMLISVRSDRWDRIFKARAHLAPRVQDPFG